MSTPVMDGGQVLTPTDLHAAYRIPDTAVTTTVAVVDAYGDSSVESNLAQYRSTFGLPPCTRANGCLSVVNQSGGTSLPADDANWAGETDLDVQMISAVCATCHILLVEANNDGYGLDQAVRFALTQADFVSLSWGATEDAWANDVIAELATPGKVVTVAAGDEGYGGDSPSYPATDTHVVSVGGTSLTYAGGVWTDTVWNDVDGASGSGCSLHEPQPSWQAGLAAISAVCHRRLDNDVAVVADPETGVAEYTAGAWYLAGGTSAGAPMVAAMYAVADAGMRPSTSVGAAQVAYGHPGEFRDVVSGSDGSCGSTVVCVAGPGYDGPSGLGVPNGVAAFASPGSVPEPAPTPPGSGQSSSAPRPSVVTYSRSASTVAYGGWVSLSCRVTDRATRAALAGARVQLQAWTTSGWRPVGALITSGTGTARASVRPPRSTTFRWYLPAYSSSGVQHAAAASRTFAVAVKIAKGRVRLTGKARAGRHVRVKTTGWGPRAVRYRFVWYVGSRRVGTGRTLALKKRWRGKSVRVVVTAHASGLRAVSARTSARRVTK